jgi:hypothetical protein
MSEPRWTVQDGGDDRASALLDRGVVAGVFYKPWSPALVYRIAHLLNEATAGSATPIPECPHCDLPKDHDGECVPMSWSATPTGDDDGR